MRKFVRQFSVLMVLFVAATSTDAFALKIGTKFVCCEAVNASCPGGGGTTVYIPRLKDRALTQADAYPRCRFMLMQWNTHSCPATSGCIDEEFLDADVSEQ